MRLKNATKKNNPEPGIAKSVRTKANKLGYTPRNTVDACSLIRRSTLRYLRPLFDEILCPVNKKLS